MSPPPSFEPAPAATGQVAATARNRAGEHRRQAASIVSQAIATALPFQMYKLLQLNVLREKGNRKRGGKTGSRVDGRKRGHQSQPDCPSLGARKPRIWCAVRRRGGRSDFRAGGEFPAGGDPALPGAPDGSAKIVSSWGPSPTFRISSFPGRNRRRHGVFPLQRIRNRTAQASGAEQGGPLRQPLRTGLVPPSSRGLLRTDLEHRNR